MSVDLVLRGAVALVDLVARRAVQDAGEMLALRAIAVAGVDAEMMDGVVRLRARGLRARAFGSRRRAADPRLAGLVTGDGG